MTQKNTQNVQFTDISATCIQNAIVLTKIKKPFAKKVHADELFLGCIQRIWDYKHADILASLLGITDIGPLLFYIESEYLSLPHDTHNTQASWLEFTQTIKSWIQKMYNENTTKLWLVSMITLAITSISKDMRAELSSHNIDIKNISEKVAILLHNPAIQYMWLFAFCDTLNTLWQSISLDFSSIDMIDIQNLQDLPTHLVEKLTASDDVDVLDRDETENKKTQNKNKEEKKLTIEHFSTDLTDEATKKHLDPVIGRESEIQQVIYTLMRKSKNNPLLLGEPGVGKTAIVEWLAHRIADGNVPEKLKKKRIMMLDLGSMVAGTKYRGEFEARFKAIMEEAADITNNIILFIDEIHGIIGAGGMKGTDDASQLIKPLLARGKIMLIGATTYDEYQQHIEGDAALKRRLQEVHVAEPDTETTKEIISGIKKYYEDFHGVMIEEWAIDKAIKLSQRYIMNKHLPDKALDIIDEASARKSTLINKLENDDLFIQEEKKLQNIQAKIEKAIASQDYFWAAELKKKENTIKESMRRIREKKSLPHHMRPHVLAEDVSTVLADKTWIPAHVVSENEIQKLLRLETDLKKNIVGQDEAIWAVVKTLQKNRLSLVEKDGPIASFLFLGPSGTWKTSLAKLIAKDYFGDEKALIRFDMSEYMEQYSVSKLIGSAPWYVWHESWGKLTEAIRRKPYSVVLLDEIEKASPDLLNILLQILDEGKMTDSKGREISFKSTIIIMTSNLGHEEYSKEISSIWFTQETTPEQGHEELTERVMSHVKNFMTPELLNRITHKIVFAPLTKQVLWNIFKIKVDEFLSHRKKKENIKLPRFTKKKIESIIEDIYDPSYGARPVVRYIHDTVEEEMINQVIENAKA